jgi:hypothetical protein
MGLTAPIFMKLTLAAQLFVKNWYIEFHENPPAGLALILGHSGHCRQVRLSFFAL